MRSLLETNMALRGKIVWRMYKENNRPWAKVFQYKYKGNGDPCTIFINAILPLGSAIGNGVKKVIDLMIPRLKLNWVKEINSPFGRTFGAEILSLEKMRH